MPEPNLTAFLLLMEKLFPALVGAALASEKVERGEMSIFAYMLKTITTNLFRYMLAVSFGYYIGGALSHYFELEKIPAHCIMFSVSLFSYRLYDSVGAAIPKLINESASVLPEGLRAMFPKKGGKDK